MLNHIKADLYRITKKKSFYIMMAIFTIGFSVIAINFTSMPEEFPEFMSLIAQMSPILIGVFIFGAIYSDDLKSHTIQSAIGFGRGRSEIVVTKIIEAALLLLYFYIYVFIHILLVNVILSFNMSPEAFKMIGYTAITSFIGTIVYFSIAGIINFTFQSSTLTTVFYVLLSTGFVENIFNMLMSFSFVDMILGWMKPYFIEQTMGKLLMSLNGVGSLTEPLVVMAVYLIGSTLLTCFLFNKVELDF